MASCGSVSNNRSWSAWREVTSKRLCTRSAREILRLPSLAHGAVARLSPGRCWPRACAGLRVFATGGIGGVHRQPVFDVSADLGLLACSPLVVVCAGAKAILDLDATLEYLETNSVPVIGFQTDEFPAFYSRSSGMKTSARADTPEQIAEIARAHWGMGMQSAVLVTVPPPESSALPPELVELAIQQALAEAQAQQVRGQAVTPFLLQRVSQLTRGSSLLVNLDILKNNARARGREFP